MSEVQQRRSLHCCYRFFEDERKKITCKKEISVQIFLWRGCSETKGSRCQRAKLLPMMKEGSVYNI